MDPNDMLNPINPLGFCGPLIDGCGIYGTHTEHPAEPREPVQIDDTEAAILGVCAVVFAFLFYRATRI